MRQAGSRAIVVPILVVCVTQAVLGTDLVVPIGLASLALISLAPFPRLEVGPLLQWLVVVLVGFGAGAVTATLSPDEVAGALGPPWTLASSFLLAACCARLYIRDPWGGPLATLAGSLGALAACGGGRFPIVYPIMCVLFLGSAFWVRRRTDVERGSISSRARWAALGTVLLALPISGALVLLLPLGHDAVVSSIVDDVDLETTGFSTRFMVGASLREPLQSNRRALRVHGDGGEYLRGEVYVDYAYGWWTPDSRAQTRALTLPTESPSGIRVETLDDKLPRYFVPSDSRPVAVAEEQLLVDDFGALHPFGGTPTEIVVVRDQPLERRSPTRRDLLVPAQVLSALQPIAEEWTRQATTDRERIEALERELLTGYGYSLGFVFQGGRGNDPTVDFVRRREPAHCEYFASATVLMARSLGIPARMIGGFRNGEHNHLLGYTLVRQRHAHAWAEVWLDGQWETVDPTPPAGLPGGGESESASWATIVSDGAVVVLHHALDALADLGVAGGAAIVLPLLMLLWFIRWWRRAPKEPPDVEHVAYEGVPPAELPLLISVLTKSGIEPAPSDSLLGLARRAQAADQPETADLLRKYAALRYGGQGDADDLRRQLAMLAGGPRPDTSQG